MTPYLLTLTPRTAFGDAIYGDTLFGQVCWALAYRLGDDALSRLLDGYTQGKPFAVIGNAFPAGYLPRPHLPSSYFAKLENATERKAVKKNVWIARADLAHTDLAFNQLVSQSAKNGKDIHFQQETMQQPHNSINRMTGTTGEAGFAPYQSEQLWFGVDTQLDIVCLIDEARITPEQMKTALNDIALSGYGRDASVGLGKFELLSFEPVTLPHQANATHYLSLGHTAPQGLGFDAKASYYKPFVRFGRHGSMAVMGGKPFKAPVLLTQAGSVFARADIAINLDKTADLIGQGLGGESNPLSNHDVRTVHQGYAPVLRVRLVKEE